MGAHPFGPFPPYSSMHEECEEIAPNMLYKTVAINVTGMTIIIIIVIIDVTSLVHLAAKTIDEVGKEQYPTCIKNGLSLELVSSVYTMERRVGIQLFLLLMIGIQRRKFKCPLMCSKQFNFPHLHAATGPLLLLTGKKKVPLHLGPALSKHDIEDAYHLSSFGEKDDGGHPCQYHGPPTMRDFLSTTSLVLTFMVSSSFWMMNTGGFYTEKPIILFPSPCMRFFCF